MNARLLAGLTGLLGIAWTLTSAAAVVNESGGHNVPPGSETHFKVILVSPQFEGLRLIQRHRLVHETLAEELACGVHALAVHTYTDAEWRSRFGSAPMSPPCEGGGRA